jgi:hypothetical protein
MELAKDKGVKEGRMPDVEEESEVEVGVDIDDIEDDEGNEYIEVCVTVFGPFGVGGKLLVDICN